MSFTGKKLKIQWLTYHVLPFSTTKNNHGFFKHIVAAIRYCKNYNKLQHMSDVP